MISVIITAIALASTALVASTANATLPATCAEFDAAYKADKLTQYEEDCAGETTCLERQLDQLREAAMQRDPVFDPLQTDDQLKTHYGPGFVKAIIDGNVLNGVGLFVDFKSTFSYFENETTTLAPISIENDAVTINGKRCSAPLRPYLSLARRKALCNAAVDFLKVDHPQTTVDLGVCLEENSDFWIGNLSDDVNQAFIVVMREAQAPGEMPFMCSAAIDRATDEVAGIDCQVEE